MNSSGKVLVIFLIITAVLLISLTAISLFFFQKETDRRKLVEVTLEEMRNEKSKIESDLEEVKKQNLLLQGKNKEADDRINDLSDELELEKGLREEVKLETVALKEQIGKMIEEQDAYTKQIKENDALRDKLTGNLLTSKQKIKALEAQLKEEIEQRKKFSELYEKEQQRQQEMPNNQAVKVQQSSASGKVPIHDELAPEPASQGVELGEIVVIPGESKTSLKTIDASEYTVKESVQAINTAFNGRILSVDIETEFVIVSLGEKDGLTVGHILSVYRDDNYVGDIKITRLQSEMSAADLIHPLSISNVQKNDQVKVKQ